MRAGFSIETSIFGWIGPVNAGVVGGIAWSDAPEVPGSRRPDYRSPWYLVPFVGKGNGSRSRTRQLSPDSDGAGAITMEWGIHSRIVGMADKTYRRRLVH